MSDHVDELMSQLSEYFAIAESTREADEAALTQATERIAQILGDNGMKPGDAIRLRNGAVYTCEPAFFNDGVEGTANVGQLLCRNWLALESTSEVISDAEGREILGDGIHLPGVWDEEKRATAAIEDRRAFLEELPELATYLRKLARQRRDPKVTKTARLAERLADLATSEAQAGSLRF